MEIYFGTVGNDVRAQTFFSKSDYWEVGGDGGDLVWKSLNVGMEDWRSVGMLEWRSVGMVEWKSVGMFECLSEDTIQYNTLQYITLLTIQYLRI